MEKSLPKGWVETEFANVISVMTNGGNFRQEDIRNKGYYPISRIETIWNEEIDLDRVKYAKVTSDDFEKYSLKIGDILFSHINSDKHLGKTAIYKTDVQLVHGINLLLLRCETNVLSNYVNYYLRNYRFKGGFLEIAQRSVNQSSINQKKLSSISFLLPPLSEQERIVAKLDKLFAQHEKIKKALDRIPQLLKSFRQQVLTQAVTGKLTEQWREGKDLEEWKERLIKDVATKLGSGSTPRGGSATYLSEGIPLVRSMNVIFGGIKLDGLAFINETQAFALKNVEIQFEDILLNITGASIGRLCLADQTVTGGRVNQHVFIIRPDKEIILPQYFESYLSSTLVQGFIEEIKYGAGMEAISKTQIENLQINIPPLEEQQEIVRRVESLFSKAEAIEERYQILKGKIASLPQAILHKAFKGELVPQLPTDGDAKDLLAEIMTLKKEVKVKKK